MIVRILGDARNDYNGLLVAQFKNDGKTHELTFDLVDWVDSTTHGFFGGNAVVYSHPEPMQLKFDHDYDVDIEQGRKIYKTLSQHQWKV
jgi:hypothetical protein